MMMLLAGCFVLLFSKCYCISDSRPLPQDRKFVSPVIDKLIESLTPFFQDQDLAVLFSNCFPNTLDTTVYYFGNTTTSNRVTKGTSSYIVMFFNFFINRKCFFRFFHNYWRHSCIMVKRLDESSYSVSSVCI